MNVEIPVSRIFGISGSRETCRKLCRDFVSEREFCEGNNNHNLCASSRPRIREDEQHCKSVSRYQTTEGKRGLETDKSTVMLCGRLDEETTANTTKMLLINFLL